MPTQKDDDKNFNYFDDNTCGRWMRASFILSMRYKIQKVQKE